MHSTMRYTSVNANPMGRTRGPRALILGLGAVVASLALATKPVHAISLGSRTQVMTQTQVASTGAKEEEQREVKPSTFPGKGIRLGSLKEQEDDLEDFLSVSPEEDTTDVVPVDQPLPKKELNIAQHRQQKRMQVYMQRAKYGALALILAGIYATMEPPSGGWTCSPWGNGNDCAAATGASFGTFMYAGANLFANVVAGLARLTGRFVMEVGPGLVFHIGSLIRHTFDGIGWACHPLGRAAQWFGGWVTEAAPPVAKFFRWITYSSIDAALDEKNQIWAARALTSVGEAYGTVRNAAEPIAQVTCVNPVDAVAAVGVYKGAVYANKKYTAAKTAIDRQISGKAWQEKRQKDAKKVDSEFGQHIDFSGMPERDWMGWTQDYTIGFAGLTREWWWAKTRGMDGMRRTWGQFWWDQTMGRGLGWKSEHAIKRQTIRDGFKVPVHRGARQVQRPAAPQEKTSSFLGDCWWAAGKVGSGAYTGCKAVGGLVAGACSGDEAGKVPTAAAAPAPAMAVRNPRAQLRATAAERRRDATQG